ncbi:anti-sigma factor family protein [Actinomadura verrucosospora]|uniref:Putative transmembrane anti-sigma factor n=1 Tax=Actinomadura verrucosospora TaxID=46165 RepID=A0A7D4AT81_ACTVE|nr:zf-HC2 domain-containing protein [Actinomadura verrucosospora]QKG25688.1 putative transmembrane anti-sigma factor [Actinomadura verrucosospora]
MSSQVEHTDVGAYALGLLEADDRRAFEAHLRGCGFCQAELRELGSMAEALSGIDPAEAEPPGEPAAPPAPVIDMVRRRRAADRRRRRVAYAAGAAAAAALVAIGVGVGTTLGDDGGKPQQRPPQAIVGERHRAADARTGASGTVGLVDKKWGTQVSFELTGVKGPLKCHLEAVSKSGARSVVGGWRVPEPGYGVPGSPKPLDMQGATALSRSEISSFQVVVDGGGTLLTIPV